MKNWQKKFCQMWENSLIICQVPELFFEKIPKKWTVKVLKASLKIKLQELPDKFLEKLWDECLKKQRKEF